MCTSKSMRGSTQWCHACHLSFHLFWIGCSTKISECQPSTTSENQSQQYGQDKQEDLIRRRNHSKANQWGCRAQQQQQQAQQQKQQQHRMISAQTITVSRSMVSLPLRQVIASITVWEKGVIPSPDTDPKFLTLELYVGHVRRITIWISPINHWCLMTDRSFDSYWSNFHNCWATFVCSRCSTWGGAPHHANLGSALQLSILADLPVVPCHQSVVTSALLIFWAGCLTIAKCCCFW